MEVESLNENNKGTILLKTMGYSNGGGLGNYSPGILNPFSVQRWTFEKEEVEVDAMDNIVPVLVQLDWKQLFGTLTLDHLLENFEEFKVKFPDFYQLYDLSSHACSYSIPLFAKMFEGWDPLQNPCYGVDVISAWRGILVKDDVFFKKLILEVLFTAVRISCLVAWEATDPEPMLRFLTLWRGLLLPAAVEFILDAIVMPKLLEAVELWDPREESTGLRILSPWRTVLESARWDRLMVRSVIPKLYAVLRAIEVKSDNPAKDQTQLAQLKSVFAWVDFVSMEIMIALLEHHLFSKCDRFLYSWLSSNSEPDFEEIREWFLGWKSVVGSELEAHEQIRSHFNTWLEKIDQALEDGIGTRREAKRRKLEKADNDDESSEESDLKEVLEFMRRNRGCCLGLNREELIAIFKFMGLGAHL